MDLAWRGKGVRKFGYNPDVSTVAVPEDLWFGGSTYGGYLGAAASLLISSSSTDDDAAGTGARTIFMEGLDDNLNVLSETVSLSGSSDVSAANQYRRLYRAYCVDVGSGQQNAGLINIATTDGVSMAQIGAGHGQTLQAIYTIPTSMPHALVEWAQAGVADKAGGVAELLLQTRDSTGESWRTRDFFSAGSASNRREYENSIVLAPGADIRLRIEDISANASVEGMFKLKFSGG